MGNSQGPTAEVQAAMDRKTAELRALEQEAPRHASATVNGGADPTAVQKAEAVIDAQVRAIVGVMIRGILISSPGMPPDAICRSIARVTGSLLCAAVSADLALMLKHRAGIKDAFKAGIDSTRVDGRAAEMPAKR